MERLLDRFEKANTQVVGISVDSVHSHGNWARDIGGVSYPLLADFHPKGAVAEAYGLYLEKAGITDRATVIIDAGGNVAHASSVGTSGERDTAELAALCEKVDAAYREKNGDLPATAREVTPLADGTTLYVKNNCGFSNAVLLARDNLHLTVNTRNVSDDDAARAELEAAAGKNQAPCLVEGGEALFESDKIIERFLAAKD